MLKKDQFTVVILLLPILFGLLNTTLDSVLRWEPSEYLFIPIMVPYLGFQTIRKPEIGGDPETVLEIDNFEIEFEDTYKLIL